MMRDKKLTIQLLFFIVLYYQVNFLYSQNYMEKLLQIEGEKDGDYLGGSVAGIGDINNDGYDDVIVGAPSLGNYEIGYAYVLFGNQNMDNVPDLIFHGDSLETFGRAVVRAGDINGDGAFDFIINAPGYPAIFDDSLGYWYGLDRGKVNVYFGGDKLDTLPDLSLIGNENGDYLGAILSPAGNVNGDQYEDIILSTKINSENVLDYIYYGGMDMNNVPDWILENGDMGVANAGDVNGDGYSDVIIAGKKPYAYIFFGGTVMDTIPDVILYEGTSDSTEIRGPIATAGDVNGDGYSDIIVGAGAPGPNRKVYLYFGGAEMDSLVDVLMIGHPFFDRYFGSSLACAGDVNGDGYDDVIIGDSEAYGYLGWVQLFLGGADMDSEPDLILIGWHAASAFGASVSSGGDVNKDGFDDIIIGAPQCWPTDRGTAIIYAGNGNLTSVKATDTTPITPESCVLYQNYPNPFNNQTVIRYSLPSINSLLVELRIYNLLGEEVRMLINEKKQMGTYEIVWDGRDKNGKDVTSGIYYAELKTGGFRQMKKMALVR